MIYKENGVYKIACDGCDEIVSEEFETFEDARQYTRDNDWMLDRNRLGWINICSECNK